MCELQKKHLFKLFPNETAIYKPVTITGHNSQIIQTYTHVTKRLIFQSLNFGKSLKMGYYN